VLGIVALCYLVLQGLSRVVSSLSSVLTEGMGYKPRPSRTAFPDF
jgi:hypothetical protein